MSSPIIRHLNVVNTSQPDLNVGMWGPEINYSTEEDLKSFGVRDKDGGLFN